MTRTGSKGISQRRRDEHERRTPNEGAKVLESKGLRNLKSWRTAVWRMTT
jgi:hypothetical protein